MGWLSQPGLIQNGYALEQRSRWWEEEAWYPGFDEERHKTVYFDDACDATTAPVVEICRHLSDIAQVPSGKLPDVVVVNGYADAATEWDLTAAKRVLIGHVRYGILVKQYTNRDPDYRRGP